MWGGTAGFARTSGLAFVDDVTELLNQPVTAVQRIVRRREEKVDIDNMQEADKV